MLVADDYEWEVSGAGFSTYLLMALWVLVLFRVPISWPKVKGGVKYPWVGYEVFLAEYALGMAASRAEWLK